MMRKKTILFVLLTAAALIPSASASIITFSDSATFICEGAPFAGNPGCGTNFITFGTISFVAAGSDTQTVNTPANTPFADFVIRCLDGTTTCGSTTFASDTLAVRMNIDQTSPSAANGDIPDAQIAAVGGGSVTVSGNSSNAQAQWTGGNSLTLGTIQYSISNDPLNLNPPNTNGGDTTVQGSVTDLTQTPEPPTLTLFSVGLIGFVFVGRRAQNEVTSVVM
jgi:hypothetical protein